MIRHIYKHVLCDDSSYMKEFDKITYIVDIHVVYVMKCNFYLNLFNTQLYSNSR